MAFSARSVGAFEDATKATTDLGSATGLSTESASRWITDGDVHLRRQPGDRVMRDRVGFWLMKVGTRLLSRSARLISTMRESR